MAVIKVQYYWYSSSRLGLVFCKTFTVITNNIPQNSMHKIPMFFDLVLKVTFYNKLEGTPCTLHRRPTTLNPGPQSRAGFSAFRKS